MKSEQYFAVTNAKSLAIFQACLKLVRKEAEPNSLAGIVNIQNTMDQTIYIKGTQ